MSCVHSNINHQIYLKCCNKYYNCYYCHNEENNHIVKKSDIKNIKCTSCNEIQDIIKIDKTTNKCSKCNIRFSEYYCSICKFWSNKEIKHCEKCNICYIKTKNELIHCDVCDKCYSENIFKIHSCNLNKNNEECQICFENFKKSDIKSYFLKCEHKIHVTCYNKYYDYCKKNKKQFTCGLCRANLI